MIKVEQRIGSILPLFFFCSVSYAGVYIQDTHVSHDNKMSCIESNDEENIDDVSSTSSYQPDHAERTFFKVALSKIGSAFHRPLKALTLFLALQQCTKTLQFSQVEAFEVTNINQDLNYTAQDLSIKLLPIIITPETPNMGCIARITVAEPFLTSCIMGTSSPIACNIVSTSSIAQSNPSYTSFFYYGGDLLVWQTTDFARQSYVNNALSSIVVSRSATYDSLITLTAEVVCIGSRITGTISIRYVIPSVVTTTLSTVYPTPMLPPTAFSSTAVTQSLNLSTYRTTTTSESVTQESSYPETTGSNVEGETRKSGSTEQFETSSDLSAISSNKPPYSIIGGVIGSVIGCAVMGGVVTCIYKKRMRVKKNSKATDNNPEIGISDLQQSRVFPFSSTLSTGIESCNEQGESVILRSLSDVNPRQPYAARESLDEYKVIPVQHHYGTPVLRSNTLNSDHYTILSKEEVSKEHAT
jgi:hypothetical protein